MINKITISNFAFAKKEDLLRPNLDWRELRRHTLGLCFECT
jgi:hypothetical protein